MFEIREITGQEYRNHYAGEEPASRSALETVGSVDPATIATVTDIATRRHRERELVAVGER